MVHRHSVRDQHGQEVTQVERFLSFDRIMYHDIVVMMRRHFVRDQHRDEVTQVELFLNSVKLLANLTLSEKNRLLDVLEKHTYPAGTEIIVQVHYFDQPVSRYEL